MPTHAPMHESAQTEFSSSNVIPRSFRPSKTPMCNPAAGPPPARQIARFGLTPPPFAFPVLFPRDVIASTAALLALGELAPSASIAAMASVVSPVARSASRLIASIAAIATAGSLCALDGDDALGWLDAGVGVALARRQITFALASAVGLVGIHVKTPILSDITGRGLGPSPIRIPSLWNCLHVRAFSLQLPVLKLQPIWYPGSRPGQRLFACGSAVMAHITTRYQAGPLGCAVQVRSCSSRLMTSWMNAMSSTTAKWAPSLMWTCRRELVKRPQPRACLRDT